VGLFAAGFEGGLKITGSSAFTSGTVKIESSGTLLRLMQLLNRLKTLRTFGYLRVKGGRLPVFLCQAMKLIFF
jgi:hypothetical protein